MAVVVAVVLALLQVLTLQQVHIMVDMVLMVVLVFRFLLQDHLQILV